MEFIREGSRTAVVSESRAAELVDGLLTQLRQQRGPLRRVLILPPDITRYHSWAGFLTRLVYERLRSENAHVAILPAVGTHEPMTEAEMDRMFPGVPHDVFHAHDWRNGVVP